MTFTMEPSPFIITCLIGHHLWVNHPGHMQIHIHTMVMECSHMINKKDSMTLTTIKGDIQYLITKMRSFSIQIILMDLEALVSTLRQIFHRSMVLASISNIIKLHTI